jgi:hypothetical protein
VALGEKPISERALRKRRRRAENDDLAKEARFWKGPKTALRMGYERPVNRLAAKDLESPRPAKRAKRPKLQARLHFRPGFGHLGQGRSDCGR